MQTYRAQFSETATGITLQVADRSHHFRRCVGLGYLLELLRHPGRHYHAQSLARVQHEIAPEYKLLNEKCAVARLHQDIYPHDFFPAIPMADWQTVREVSRQLNALIAQEALIREYNDLGSLEDLLEQKDQLSSYLSEVLNHNGKIVCFKEAQSKAVNTMHKNLKRAIASIAHCEPEFGDALKRGVHTWQTLYYQPNEWEIEL